LTNKTYGTSPSTGDVVNKVYTPSYSITQPTPSYAKTSANKITPTHASYSTGAELLIDKGKIESEICVNIMLGVTQLKEGIKVIETKKSSLSKEDWDSDSDETYKEYLDNFLNYMNEVSGFFEALSQKIINDAEVFEELDSYINKIISSGADIAGWR
jgi:argonaute-like protein implicated in RNA metabolism and viral defense